MAGASEAPAADRDDEDVAAQGDDRDGAIIDPGEDEQGIVGRPAAEPGHRVNQSGDEEGDRQCDHDGVAGVATSNGTAVIQFKVLPPKIRSTLRGLGPTSAYK